MDGRMEREERIEAVLELRTALQAMKDDLIATEMLEGGFPQKVSSAPITGSSRDSTIMRPRPRRRSIMTFLLTQQAGRTPRPPLTWLPHGVIAHIGIWNYPFWQNMITLIPALMAGNAVVFKPSELTTMTGLKIKEAFGHTSMPPELFQTLIGGADIGKAMVTAPFDALVFTGGRATGLDITRNAGIKPMVLELSGNDPGIVCSDVNVSDAARGVASGAFSTEGRSVSA